jgi:signal-transduction protein with cAMP-binding, CBS, and nucleotidyltransferase domain
MPETDLSEKVAAGGMDHESITVHEIMSKPIITVPSKGSIQECAALLTRADIQRVRVFDGQETVGIVSISDIFDAV